MDDICSHLKISKKTLYQYFSNKDDLVEQIMMHRRNNYRTQKDIEELKQHNSIEIMLTIRDHIIRSFNSRMPANLFDLKKYHPDVYQRVNNKDQIFIQNLFNEVIDKGIRDGYFRSDINREIQVYLFVKQMSLIGEPEMISELKYPISTIVSTIVENIISSNSQSGIRMILFDTKETVHHHDGRTLWNQIEYSFSLYDNFPVVHFNLHCTMLCPIPKWSSIFSTSNPAALMHRSISSE